MDATFFADINHATLLLILDYAQIMLRQDLNWMDAIFLPSNLVKCSASPLYTRSPYIYYTTELVYTNLDCIAHLLNLTANN